MAINTNVQGSSLIPETQRKYLELLMQNYPEYKAGLFESTAPGPEWEDVYQAPRGPLYNVKPTAEQLVSDDYYFDEGDVDVVTGAPKGPLYDVDPEQTMSMIEAMPKSSSFQNYLDTFNVYNDLDEQGNYSMSQNVYEPGMADSYAEWQLKDFELPEKKFAGNVNIKDMAAWGSTPGTYKDEASRISLQKRLMDLVGTKPTSPRNEEKIDVGKGLFYGFDKAYPKDINKFAADVLGHEYRHNILEGPGFEEIREEIMGINPNKIFANPKSVEYLPSVYAAGAYKDADDRLKEELFNEAADMYNQYLMTGNMGGIMSHQNMGWMNKNLNPFYRPNQEFKHGSGSMDYFNTMLPTVKKYFTEVDRQGAMGPVNKAKLKVGMPENLSFNTGAGNAPISTPISVPVPAHISGAGNKMGGPQGRSRGRDRGRSRRRGETEQIAGGHHFSRGGLMDIPLPGRSRDI